MAKLTQKMQSEIAEAIVQMRLERGLSQELLAEKSDIHRNYIGRIERQDANISIAILCKIAKGLEVKPSEILLKANL